MRSCDPETVEAAVSDAVGVCETDKVRLDASDALSVNSEDMETDSPSLHEPEPLRIGVNDSVGFFAVVNCAVTVLVTVAVPMDCVSSAVAVPVVD